MLNGLTTAYLKNGKIDYTAEYKNGEIYNGVYHGAVAKRVYKNGAVIKDIEHDPPNANYVLKTTIYGKDIDSVFWRTAKGKQLGLGIYKNNTIIDGLEVLNLLDNTVHTNYKNKLREGVQKVYGGNGTLVANMTYKNDQLILDETLNPLTHKMVSCTYKNNEPFTGRYFEYKPMFKHYIEFVYEDGELIEKNSYKEIEGKLVKYHNKR